VRHAVRPLSFDQQVDACKRAANDVGDGGVDGVVHVEGHAAQHTHAAKKLKKESASVDVYARVCVCVLVSFMSRGTLRNRRTLQRQQKCMCVRVVDVCACVIMCLVRAMFVESTLTNCCHSG
jgi:hypothetical protein